MTEPDFTSNLLRASRVAIWGLGLMGGSLAMALHGKCAALAGIDTDPKTLALARENNVVDVVLSVDEIRAHSENALVGIDLIVLAAPVRAIIGLVKDLPGLCPGQVVVMDLGSTKAAIMAAMQALPERFDPVGGHPMCGKEKSSLENAEGGLYKGAPFVLVHLDRTTAQARMLAEELARAVAACPLWLSAEEHDRWVASTSHLPFLAACALAQVTPTAAAALVGPGFRSTTRLAGSSARMMVDILATNRDNIRVAIDDLITQLTEYDLLLELGDFQGLEARFDSGAEQHERLTGGLGQKP